MALSREVGERQAPIWHPKWALDAFWNFEIPQDLVEGYGYPQLTEQAKRKILGENFLRLSGMDVDETRRRLAAVAYRWYSAGTNAAPTWSWGKLRPCHALCLA